MSEPSVNIWGSQRDFESGAITRDLLHVDDAVSGILGLSPYLFELPHVSPTNIASEREVSIRQLFEMCCNAFQLANVPKLTFSEAKPVGQQRRLYCCRKARALGYYPEISIQSGLTQLVHWYLSKRGMECQ
jgi:nucleoside-diphosphate-sugar epimerase